jgi:hypothetical protein
LKIASFGKNFCDRRPNRNRTRFGVSVGSPSFFSYWKLRKPFCRNLPFFHFGGNLGICFCPFFGPRGQFQKVCLHETETSKTLFSQKCSQTFLATFPLFDFLGGQKNHILGVGLMPKFTKTRNFFDTRGLFVNFLANFGANAQNRPRGPKMPKKGPKNTHGRDPTLFV